MNLFAGIDIGTTHCTVETNRGYHLSIRTTVYVQTKNDFIVGLAAERYALIHPNRIIYSALKDLGSARKYIIDQFIFTPTEILTIILAELKKNIDFFEGHLKESTDVVLSVPNYFSACELNEILKAAKLADLNVIDIIHQSIAIAYSCYEMWTSLSENICFLDMGGGALDISLLKIIRKCYGQPIISIVKEKGAKFGGDCFDDIIIDYLIKEGIVFEHKNQLKFEVEQAKSVLSCCSQTMIITSDNNFHTSEILLTDIIFRDIIKMKLEEICMFINNTINLGGNKINNFCLLGGSFMSPIIKNAISAVIRQEPIAYFNTQFIVAKGALIFLQKNSDKCSEKRSVTL